MTGEDLVDAQTAFDQQTNEPVVNFRLSTGGARKFGDVTAKNVGRPFAIVLDDKVISAPVIREPILGGSGPDQRQLHRRDAPTISPSCSAPARCRPS